MRYSTRNEAIQRVVIDSIEGTGIASADEYDIEAIADEVLGDYSEGYAQKVDSDQFWEIVQKHVR